MRTFHFFRGGATSSAQGVEGSRPELNSRVHYILDEFQILRRPRRIQESINVSEKHVNITENGKPVSLMRADGGDLFSEFEMPSAVRPRSLPASPAASCLSDKNSVSAKLANAVPALGVRDVYLALQVHTLICEVGNRTPGVLFLRCCFVRSLPRSNGASLLKPQLYEFGLLLSTI
jgi:hypothetical protein